MNINRNQQVSSSRIKNKSDEKGNKPKLNKKKFVLAMVVIFFVIYFVYTMIWQQMMLSKKNRQIEQLQQEIQQATAQTEKLEKELSNLNDPDYLEKIAREKLGLVLPNERVFVDANKSEANTAE